MGVRLADGRRAAYPSLDGEGIAVDPHQERPDVTWSECEARWGLETASLLQVQAEANARQHVEHGCTLKP